MNLNLFFIASNSKVNRKYGEDFALNFNDFIMR